MTVAVSRGRFFVLRGFPVCRVWKVKCPRTNQRGGAQPTTARKRAPSSTRTGTLRLLTMLKATMLAAALLALAAAPATLAQDGAWVSNRPLSAASAPGMRTGV